MNDSAAPALSSPADPSIADEELAVRREELKARQAEASAKLRSTAAPWWSKADPLVLAVAAGVFTLAGNIGVAWYNSRESTAQETLKAKNALDLEREKAKSTLIIQAVSTSDPEAAQRNLSFFLDSGLLPDKDNKIREAAKKYAPVLPSASGGTRTPPTTPEAYTNYFWSMNLRPEAVSAVDRTIERIVAGQQRLENVARAAHTPWYVIGVLWIRETNGRFDRHLHNGDPLTGPTVHLPVGRPRPWPPPDQQDPWEYSAADALQFYKLAELDSSDIGDVLARLEASNGTGYQKRGVFTPYLWGGTDLYEKGKYVAEGRFDPNVVDKQIGVAALLRRMHDKGIIRLRGGTPTAAQ